MQADFGLPVGYSDHTIGAKAAAAAVALGACVIEKHVQADRVTGSPDAAFSSTVSEMGEFVSAVREAQAMRGHAQYGPTTTEEYLRGLRRSIIATRDLQAGTLIGPGDIVVRRPNIGLLPRDLGAVIGARLTREFARGEGLDWDGLEQVDQGRHD
jgi:sialic acid synthase SpsE